MKLSTVLPPLTGRWLVAYRVLWALTFLLSLVGASVGSWWGHRNATLDEAYYRLGLRGVPTGQERVILAPLAESARQAGVVFGIFAASEKVIELLGAQCFPGSLGAFSGAIAAAVAAALFAPVRSRLDAWADRRFRPALTRMRQRLPEVLEDLREGASLREFGEAVLEQVERGVLATRGVLLVPEDGTPVGIAMRNVTEREFERWSSQRGMPAAGQHPADSVFPLHIPLVVGSGPAQGWLLLGPRPDGSLHGRDELEALQAIARPLARAVVVARRHARQAAAIDARLSALESALDAAVAHR